MTCGKSVKMYIIGLIIVIYVCIYYPCSTPNKGSNSVRNVNITDISSMSPIFHIILPLASVFHLKPDSSRLFLNCSGKSLTEEPPEDSPLFKIDVA